MSLSMQVRPSELMEISHPYDAWCFDEAIWLLGQKLRRGEQLVAPKTKDNSALLKKLGVK